MLTSVASTFRKLAMSILILLVAWPGSARADKVNDLIGQLTTSRDVKVRLSAAVSLAKLGDDRAVPAFIKALSDSDKNVRGVAATSLARLITAETDASLRKRALTALDSAARRDKESFVRKQAKQAQQQIQKLEDDGDSGGGGGGGGGIYINLGAMSAKTKSADKMRGLMRQAAQKTFSEKANGMSTMWNGGEKPPSEKQLREAKTAGYHVDGTLISLEAESKGSTTLVSCKISMLIATFPEKSMFGFLDGGAKVQTGSSAQDIEYAQQDCVSAVIEDLVAKKIIPVIQQRH